MIHAFTYSGVRFNVPRAYAWVVRKGLLGEDGKSPLEPWHLLPDEACRSLSETWACGPSLLPLVTFAKRQDNDDYACFEIESGEVRSIVAIHGWTASGYDITRRFGSIWEWLKDAIDDAAEWQDIMDAS